MRFIRVLLGICMGLIPAYAQTIALLNLSAPNTGIEVGNVVKVAITGAAQDGAVTVTLNGGSPTYMGQTNSQDGSFSVQATETSATVGSWEEHWYVNGIEVIQPGTNSYLTFAPELPFFTVSPNFSGSNCAIQGYFPSACGTGNLVTHWIWSPVTYESSSSALPSSSVDADAGQWNSVANGKISLSSDVSHRLDAWIYDDTSLGQHTFGETLVFGQDCDAYCYNQVDLCTGACFSTSAVYHTYILLNPPEIANLASALGTSSQGQAAQTVYHELGHTLMLGDITADNGICSEVQDIMYQAPSVRYLCHITAPNSCDTAGINDADPSAVGYCSSGTNNQCNGQACS
jgi:hypothetical protein